MGVVDKVTQGESKREKKRELTFGWRGMEKKSHGDWGRAARRIGGEPGEDGLWSPDEEVWEGGSGQQRQVSCKLKSALWN